MNCLECFNRATGKLKRTRTIIINNEKYNVYICNVCGNKVLIPAWKDK